MIPEINYLPKSFDEMVQAMLACEQTKGQSVFQHGTSVREHTFRLINYLKGGNLDGEWRLPEWFLSHKDLILSNLHSKEDIELYAQYHDCSKPFVLIIDDQGKRHFPNHAAASRYIWELVGGNPVVGKLIGADMDIHTLKAEEINQKLQLEWSAKDAITLLLTSLCEIHSNSKLFGGLDSISFKMKWKTVEKRGNQICKFLKK